MSLIVLPLPKETNTKFKMKTFLFHSLDRVDAVVNEWMEQEGASIRHVAQSQCEKQGRFILVLSVFYRTEPHQGRRGEF